MEKNKHHIYGFIGLSSSGKTSLAKHLSKKFGFIYVPTITTRPPRRGNIREHRHISINEFKKLIKGKELLEYTKFVGHYYGRLKKDVHKALRKNHIVYTLSANRVNRLKKKYENVKIILVEPEDPIYKTIEKRLQARKIKKRDLIKRLTNAKKEQKIINRLKKSKLINHTIKTIESKKSYARDRIEKVVKKHLS